MPAVDYAAIVRHYTAVYGVRVRRWRRAMSGVAQRVTMPDGRRCLYVESPRPRTPLTLALFLHEIGHHAIGFDTYVLSCHEEFQAWQFALRHMRRLGVAVTPAVERRVELSMQYAVGKAMRRGMEKLPAPLNRYVKAA
jgi:hypothetical protein